MNSLIVKLCYIYLRWQCDEHDNMTIIMTVVIQCITSAVMARLMLFDVRAQKFFGEKSWKKLTFSN